MQYTLPVNKVQTLNAIYHISYLPFLISNETAVLYRPASLFDCNSILDNKPPYDAFSTGSSIIHEEDNPNVYYYLRMVTEHIACIIGPVSTAKVDLHYIHEYTKKYKIDAMSNVYIPVASIEQVLEVAALISTIILSSDIKFSLEYHDHSFVPKNEKPISDYTLTTKRLDYAERNIPHMPPKLETSIINALLNGNEEEFYLLLQETATYESNEYHLSPIKSMEYNTVAMIAILTRALINNHFSAIDAYNLSDLLLSRMNNLKSVSDFENYLNTIVFPSFFHLVHSQKPADEPQIINDCKSYILHHLNQPLSLDKIASEINVSKTYLSALFHQKEGITLSEYIHRERIQAAANMLKYSDYSILRIANYFQYQTQSHFGVIFKKYMKMTPAMYRKRNHDFNNF